MGAPSMGPIWSLALRMMPVLALALLSSCGGGTATTPAPPAAHSPRPIRLQARVLGRLPAPVQLPAAAALPGGPTLVLGGLSSQATSVPTAVAVAGGRARKLPDLPLAVHDAAAAAIGGRAYFFGGGSTAGSSAAILAVDSAGHAAPAGRLPTASSDLAAAAVGNTAMWSVATTARARSPRSWPSSRGRRRRLWRSCRRLRAIPRWPLSGRVCWWRGARPRWRPLGRSGASIPPAGKAAVLPRCPQRSPTLPERRSEDGST